MCWKADFDESPATRKSSSKMIIPSSWIVPPGMSCLLGFPGEADMSIDASSEYFHHLSSDGTDRPISEAVSWSEASARRSLLSPSPAELLDQEAAFRG